MDQYDVSQIAIKKNSYLHSQILYKQIVIQSCFLPSNYDEKVGLIPSNTQGFPVFMKSVSKTVDFSTLHW